MTAAASALREAAGFPALSGARAERYLAPARRLGEPVIARLWAQGLAMDSDAAVALALSAPHEADGGRDTVTLAAVGAYEVAAAPPGTLTPRERQVAVLVASGHSNKAIADELVISPATAARHVANILAKLGFSSRAQIAAWTADRQLGLVGPAAANGPAQRDVQRADGASQRSPDDRRRLPGPGGPPPPGAASPVPEAPAGR
jgi:DNA-binding CsgD family transcriptional regulator